jgi:hypothetical protein
LSNRKEAIQKIEKIRTSKVICYLTGDKQPFITQIGEDIIPILLKHLELMGEQDNIDLLLYTRGGDMVVPIRIVKLIRTYCKKKFSILVPYRCHSAGTLICLGANEIVMTKIAELTPVDPTTAHHAYIPKMQGMPLMNSPQADLPISVEDVRSYLMFAKEVLGAQEGQVVDLYSKMTSQSYPSNLHLHPLVLGNVYRVQQMIKKITQRLLALHFDLKPDTEDHRIKKIIKEITEDISVHNYPIYFDEAKDLGLNVIQETKNTEKLILDLFAIYSDTMKLNLPFNPLDELGEKDLVRENYYGAYLESEKALDVFNFTYEIKKPLPIMQPGVQIPITGTGIPPMVNILKSQWEEIQT